MGGKSNLQQEVIVADQYNEISDEDRKKADAFFKSARTVGGTGNYDYAIEMYTQGLMIDPENTDAHIDLRDISMKRKASGGKAMGFFDARKHSTNNKDDKLNMVNAE